MCGLVTVISKKAIDPKLIERMTARLEHRGPDGVDFHYGENFAFGHRRLAIVDLSERGRQPMHYAKRYVIVYNGEIYNFRELRAELMTRGYRFNTQTDTEVIMAAYDCWGVKALQKFNGMWAFVLYDTTTRRFLISRDRFGEKPLYFARTADSLIIASEIKALLLHPQMARAPNIDYCRRFVRWGPAEYLRETAFDGVQRFMNACYVEGSAEQLLSAQPNERRYWRLQPNTDSEPCDPKKLTAYTNQYFELLQDAVALRLRADVKIGSLLSGGLDSSSIVYLVDSLLAGRPMRDAHETFSCVYRSPGTTHCDESVYISEVAHSVSVQSSRIEPDVAEVPHEHRRMIYYFDTPPESTVMSSWHTLRRVARSDVKVTLDGQGADEQLTGYQRYAINAVADARNPFRAAWLARQLPGLGRFTSLGVVAGILNRLGLPRLLPAMLRAAGKQVYEGTPLNEALAYDAQHGLLNLLHYADRTSMAFSVESRMPFLDYRLAEFLTALPGSYKFSQGWTKFIARQAFNGKLPNSVTWRRDKMGWPAPEDYWFTGPLQEWATTQIASSEFVSSLGAESFRASHSDKSLVQMARLLNLATWHRIHMEEQWQPAGLPRLEERGASSARKDGVTLSLARG